MTTPASDTKSLIETAVNRFLAEVPAPAARSKLGVAGLELRARHDVQLYRVELPGPKVTKDIAADCQGPARGQRAQFNELATKGHIADWEEAFAKGEAKATGIEQVLKLIANVVERQQERSRTRRAHWRPTARGTRPHPARPALSPAARRPVLRPG